MKEQRRQDTPEEEVETLLRVRDALDKELIVVHERNRELTAEIEHREATMQDMVNRIKFLEGQVAAYEYCVSHRM